MFSLVQTPICQYHQNRMIFFMEGHIHITLLNPVTSKFTTSCSFVWPWHLATMTPSCPVTYKTYIANTMSATSLHFRPRAHLPSSRESDQLPLSKCENHTATYQQWGYWRQMFKPFSAYPDMHPADFFGCFSDTAFIFLFFHTFFLHFFIKNVLTY